MTFSLHSQLLRLNDEIKKSVQKFTNGQKLATSTHTCEQHFMTILKREHQIAILWISILSYFIDFPIFINSVRCCQFFPVFSQFCLIFSFLSRAIEDFNLVFLCLFFQLKSAVNRCNSYFIVSATFTRSAFWMLFENHGNFKYLYGNF